MGENAGHEGRGSGVARAWAAVGHAVAGRVREALAEDEHAVVVVHDETTLRFVQLNGHPTCGWYLEAASGEYTDDPVTPGQRRRLVERGWRSPDESTLRPGPANYWDEVESDLYAVVTRLLDVLADVFAADPDDVAVERVRCAHCAEAAAYDDDDDDDDDDD